MEQLREKDNFDFRTGSPFDLSICAGQKCHFCRALSVNQKIFHAKLQFFKVEILRKRTLTRSLELSKSSWQFDELNVVKHY